MKKGYKEDMDDKAKLKGVGLAKKGKKAVKKGYKFGKKPADDPDKKKPSDG